MEQIMIGGILAFIVTFYSIPVIIKVANAKKLYDEPDDARKIHTKPIPSLGGLGIFIGFTLCLLLTGSFSSNPHFQYYFAAFLIIFFVGIKDDILGLSPMKKFLCQLLVAGILMFQADLRITNMHDFLGIGAIPDYVSYPLTMFTIVVIVNAFNLIDGVDGLAGGIGFVTSLVFGIFFAKTGNMPYALLGFGFAASVLAFLYYNFNPAKIFMGDTGSLLMGLVNSILVIRFIETGSTYTKDAAPAIGFAIMLLPLMDTLRVFAIRIMHGRSPFSPDRNHIHHLLLDRGLNHKSVSISCVVATCLVIGAAFALVDVGTTYLILGLVTCFFGVIYWLFITKPRPAAALRVVKKQSESELEEEPSGRRIRLVSFFNRAVAVDED